MPEPVECLEHLGVAAGALKECVPLIFECIEAGARRYEIERRRRELGRRSGSAGYKMDRARGGRRILGLAFDDTRWHGHGAIPNA
jgi:hypothetical protein